MMAAFILAFSLVTLLMFFVSYCRSLTASSSHHSLSEEVRDVTGIRAVASSGDFGRVIQLLRLCPERPEDRARLRLVAIYYALLNFSQKTWTKLIPSLSSWSENERAACSHFAAVALDRCILFNREMLAQQFEL
jgi:hypothetical protein